MDDFILILSFAKTNIDYIFAEPSKIFLKSQKQCLHFSLLSYIKDDFLRLYFFANAYSFKANLKLISIFEDLLKGIPYLIKFRSTKKSQFSLIVDTYFSIYKDITFVFIFFVVFKE